MVIIMGLNIWNYNEPWTTRRELIAQAIRRADADLVALQEVRYDSSYQEDPRHQAAQVLAGLDGYEMIWQPAMRYPSPKVGEDLVQWEGLAILSRLPIVDRRHTWLSREPEDVRDNHQRIVLGARAITPQGPFWFFTTHLSLSARGRARTIVEVYRLARDTAGQEPFAITGDFNAEPGEPPVRFLLGEETLEGRRGNWADAWLHRRPTEEGFTHSAWEPNKRIDYVFLPRAEMVREIEIVGHQPDGEGIYPSDHLGLRAELTW